MAAEPFHVEMQLSGDGVPDGSAFRLKVDPTGRLLGAAGCELVEAKFYDDTGFFRVLDGMYDIWIAQFGISGGRRCRHNGPRKRQHDPVKASNKRGTLALR